MTKAINVLQLHNYEKVSVFDYSYGHLFIVNSVHYILLTNVYSLYSVVFTAKGVLVLQYSANKAAKNLLELMFVQEIGTLINWFVNESFYNIEVVKTSNRTTIGSMNDMIYQAEFFINEYKMPLTDVSGSLNNTSYSLIDYKSPLSVVKNMPLT